jgi:hypothetical protein
MIKDLREFIGGEIGWSEAVQKLYDEGFTEQEARQTVALEKIAIELAGLVNSLRTDVTLE